MAFLTKPLFNLFGLAVTPLVIVIAFVVYSLFFNKK